MWENQWEDLKNQNQHIVDGILQYCRKISDGLYLETSQPLDIAYYYDILTAHIISLLLDHEAFYVPTHVVESLHIRNSELIEWTNWNISENYSLASKLTAEEKQKLVEQLNQHCFDASGKNFIQEICAQDLVNDNTLAKDIASFLSSLSYNIEIECVGEEAFMNRMSLAIKNKEPIGLTTKIQSVFGFEYSNRGALIRNKIFMHKNSENAISPKINLSTQSDKVLDYRECKNLCQSAVLHIEANGSTGTGFLISEDGYALTCAHVVENVTEIYAAVVAGDGYKKDSGREGFEVYDVSYGEVVYVNKQLDIALIKMEGYRDVSYFPLEESCILPDMGDEVVVFGYPLGYELPKTNFFGPNISFYRGYITSNQVSDGNSVTFLDVDAKSGNSGSPVISVKTGKVIGIMSGIKVGGRAVLNEKMPYMIPIQHFIALNK